MSTNEEMPIASGPSIFIDDKAAAAIKLEQEKKEAKMKAMLDELQEKLSAAQKKQDQKIRAEGYRLAIEELREIGGIEDVRLIDALEQRGKELGL